MEQLPHYTHKPINASNTIRVLKLHAASDPSEPLHCSLLQVRVDTSPVHQYTALSYTWDSQVASHPIQCDDGVLLITANCFAALRALRKTDEPLTLWIDSICIDQSNTAEKSTQVAIMGQIYQFSRSVIVWLGEWDDALAQAVKILKSLFPPETLAAFEDESILKPSEEQMAINKKELNANIRNLVKGLKTAADDPFATLFNRSWFRRMWTVQEVTLAHMNRVFVYGGLGPDQTLRWSILLCATGVLGEMAYPYGKIEEAVKAQQALSLYHMAEQFPTFRDGLESMPGDRVMKRPVLYQVLLDARPKQSSDPRDKIFALFGVLKQLKIDIAIPDYEKSVEDVYREAVVSCINYDKNLNILYNVPSDRRHVRPDLSSWVPDWSDEGWRPDEYSIRVDVTLYPSFCTAGPAQPRWSFSHDQRRLIVSGKLIGSVMYCAEPLIYDFDAHSGLHPVTYKYGRTPISRQYSPEDLWNTTYSSFRTLRSWAEFTSFYDQYPTGETVQQAFIRTLVSDTAPERQEAVSTESWYKIMTYNQTDLLTLVYHKLQQLEHVGPGPPTQAVLQRLDSSGPIVSLTALNLEEEALHYHYAVLKSANRMAFFTTEEGYMGTTPARMTDTGAVNLIEAGDRIAIIAGLNMPVVLRPVEDEDVGGTVFRYVTHVYLHGVMCGEAWEDEKRVLEDIVLV